MQNLNSVITHAVKGYGEKLAEIYGLSVSRFYQILEADNYNKTRRLIRAIAAIDKDRAKLVKVDLDALFVEVLCDGEKSEVDCALLHAELNDVLQARLKNLSKAERLKECREAVAILNIEISALEKDEIRGFNGFEVSANGSR